MSRPTVIAIVFFVCFIAIPLHAQQQPASGVKVRQARVLVLTGNEHPAHAWKETAPLLAKFLAEDPRLATTISENPEFVGSVKLHTYYDVVVLNYMNWQSPGPSQSALVNFKKYVERGNGLVLVHFACGAFQDWPEFPAMAGRVWDPKLRGHDPYGKFTVDIVEGNNPITRGLKSFETIDELYTCLTGDKEIEVLATAKSKVDGKEYPIAFVNRYGTGRVFHCVLGHDVQALSNPSVQELYRRGTAWAAGFTPVARSTPADRPKVSPSP
jgi:type 1 glutamine amidotransferase